MKKRRMMIPAALILCLCTGCGRISDVQVHELADALRFEYTAYPENDAVPEQTEHEQTEPQNPASAPETASVPDDWRLILVNSTHAIPEHYDITLLQLSNGRQVDERIYPDLQEMFDAARADGYALKVGEGYRTRQEQQDMMDQKIREFTASGCSEQEAKSKAAELVAQPGTSEHELGLAVDINSDYGADPWALYGWLQDHAWQYGFILRYPQGCEQITGIEYEPWHYRYVGKDAAAEIHSQGITLEEYLESRT